MGFFGDLKIFMREHREWMLLPVLIALLLLTAMIILNRDVVHTPFVYSRF